MKSVFTWKDQTVVLKEALNDEFVWVKTFGGVFLAHKSELS